ncbi:hypothetical protein FKM82_016169 [Ascaphus truei]
MSWSIRTQSLGYSLILCLLLVLLSHGREQSPHRTPRQTSEDGAAGNKIAGTWSSWGSWSPCSQTCGLGVLERSRSCSSPYQQVPWVPGAEPAPQTIQTHSQPPFHDERANPYSFGAARPAYPLHTDGEIPAPFVPRNPPAVRYNPFNRNTRQETLPAGSQPAFQNHSPYQRSTSIRGRGMAGLPETGWQPSPVDTPHRQDAIPASDARSVHRKSHQEAPSAFSRKNISRHDDTSQPWPFFPDSIPLLRPESSDDQNPGRAAPALSPTKESRFSRRSRVRNSIKPGKYGYGKVPFALPLHKDKEDAQRFKRHHHPQGDGPSSSPRKQKRKDLHPTQSSSTDENQELHDLESTDQSSDLLTEPVKQRSQNGSHIGEQLLQRPPLRKQKIHVPSEHPVWPEKLGNISVIMGLGGSQQRELEGDPAEHDFYMDTNEESDPAPEAKSEEQGLPLKVTHNHNYQFFSQIHHFDTMTDRVRSSDLNPGSKEEVDDNPLQYTEFGKSGNIHVMQRPVSSSRALWSTEESSVVHEPSQSQKIPSTQATAVNRSEKPTAFKLLGEGSISMTDWLKTFAAPESYSVSEHQPSTEKKQEAKKIKEAKMFGTVKPRQSRAASQRVREMLVKSSGTGYQTNNENRNQSPLQNQRNTESSHRLIHKEHMAPSHNQGTSLHRRQLKNAEGTNSELMQGEVESIPYQHSYQRQAQSDSSSLTRPRNQRQSQYRHSADSSSRVFQSLFKEQPFVHRPSQVETWPSYVENPAVPYERGQDSRPGLHSSADLPQWNLYHPGTEDFHCEGEQKQYKSCSQEPCLAGQPDARAVQCATFNSQEFMGRLYQWEAFTDVRGNQRCELNCRPIGYRFYVRHTEKAQDGTPCEAGSVDVCVAGQCLSPGCDGILGSNSTLDTCGVCGGNNSSCRLITGTFNETNVPIGYHKIMEIPKGATRINVTELTRSPNYLALRSRSGKSIINGNWAVDPSGRYEAGGTVFIYTRPGREEHGGETFTAAGPTSEALDVYMIFQQDNPGVWFQFFISSPVNPENRGHPSHIPRQDYGALRMMSSSDPLPHPGSRGYPPDDRNQGLLPQVRTPSERPAGTLQRNIRVPPLSAPPVHYWPEQAPFFWKRVGNTQCSVTCGKGFWYPVFQCVSRSSLEEVSEDECDMATKPFPVEEACNTQPCPAFWDVGDWSVCSRTCGAGIQHRQVLCRQMYANRTTMVHPQRCGNLVKPNVTQTCQLRICSNWEIQTNWSTCSVMCGLGQKTRHVRCISNQGDLVSEGECSNRLRPRTNEACDMGPCVRSWFHNDWSSTCSTECGTGIQRRSVLCLSSSSTDESKESCVGAKPSDMRVCNSGPCERTVLWYTGTWSQCSADCDEGSQRRDVICVSKLGPEFNVTDPSECSHLEKPLALQSCNVGPCGSRWFSSPWSACSQSCLGGVQEREVRCLLADKTFSQLCDLDTKPDDKRVCNTQPCSSELDANCRDRYHNCAVVVQARLCVYSYYKLACCASCTHALQRPRAQEGR